MLKIIRYVVTYILVTRKVALFGPYLASAEAFGYINGALWALIHFAENLAENSLLLLIKIGGK